MSHPYRLRWPRTLLVLLASLLVALVAPSSVTRSAPALQSTGATYKVSGRHLYDRCGEKVILRGINKMIFWTDVDGLPSYAEIAKTGANVVRIQWLTTGTPAQLDTAIANAVAAQLIPMPELHDATGEWSKLPSLVDYWTRADVVAVLKKHEQNLLINIGNEVGNQVSDADYVSGYTQAVTRIRAAGLHAPLIIDAPNYGQGIDSVQRNAASIISADPDRNLMFSVHTWWPYAWGYTDQRVIDEINESVAMNLPLIIGEFGNKWDETASGAIPYKTIIAQAVQNEIGYLPWEWGPGNNPQTWLDMTTDSTYATLRDWGLEVAVTSPYSIKNTSVRPRSMVTGGCGSVTPTSTSRPTNTPTPRPTNTPVNTPTGTVRPTNTPTARPTNTPTGTVRPTNTPTVRPTNTPTGTVQPTNTPTRTPTPVGSAPCSPVTATITAPFSYDGAGTFCWQIATIPNYINSWNLASLTINGVSFTNTYTFPSNLPPKINGYWYVSYTGNYAWSHFEAK